jgi:drug/metabolite transporter (DMT)-like permease
MGYGEWAALTAALLWTFSSMLWGRIHLSAWGINLCKNVIGTAIVGLHLLMLMLITDRAVLAAPAQSWYWLGLSGFVGVVLGDTLFFRCLQIVGPRRALMLATIGPIFSVVLGWVFLRESLAYLVITGILLTVGGVVVVVSDRRAGVEAPGLIPGRLWMGFATGTLSALCQSVGGVFSKLGMRNTEGHEICGSLEATFIRLLVAAICTLIVVMVRRQLSSIIHRVIENSSLNLLVPATALGTWLGIWLSQIAYSYSNVAVAQTLLCTCPLFAIPIVWLFHRHRVTMISVVGTIVALLGVAMVLKFQTH